MDLIETGTKVKVGSHEAEIIKYLAQGGFAHIYLVNYSPSASSREELGLSSTAATAKQYTSTSTHETSPEPQADPTQDQDPNKTKQPVPHRHQQQKRAALKRVLVQNKEQLNDLRNEVSTMQKLAHNKHVVRYIDSNAEKLADGKYEVLLLMEYCPNGSLLDYMNRHLREKLTTKQILKIMYQITSALTAMHQLKLIHKDLKIENVLIDSQENFKLCDFGSTSAYINPPSSQEEFQLIMNNIIHQTTPQYRAPEMIDLYKAISIDNKSDIWALGVFLYKLMYYTTPFESQGELAILHGYFQFPELPKFPSKLKNLVIIMLQVNPALRPNVYQVLVEVCSLMKKYEVDEPAEVEFEDFYGLGAYDYQAYEAYQQQLALHQQYQMQQQQRQYLEQQQQYLVEQQQQQQRVLVEQDREGSVQITNDQQGLVSTHDTRKKLSEEVLKSEALIGAENNMMVQTHMLTKSGNTSSANLNAGDIKLDLKEAEAEADEDEDSVQLDNVEERFPDLQDLEKSITNKSNKSSLTGGTSVKSESETTMCAEAHESDSTTPFPEIESFDPLKQQSKDPNQNQNQEKSASRPGLKYTKTEAWESISQLDGKLDTPATASAQHDDIFGVFHNNDKAVTNDSSISPVPVPATTTQTGQQTHSLSAPATSKLDQFSFDNFNRSHPQDKKDTGTKNDEFDDLFSNFKTSATAPAKTNIISDTSSSSNTPMKPNNSNYTLSKNPFPTSVNDSSSNITGTSPISKNPFPTSNQQSLSSPSPIPISNPNTSSTLQAPASSHNVKPQVSGGNPWASKIIKHNSTSPQMSPQFLQAQQQQQQQQKSLTYSAQNLNRPSTTSSPPVSSMLINKIQTSGLNKPALPNRPAFHSPVITVTADEQLIDFGDDSLGKSGGKISTSAMKNRLDLNLVEVKETELLPDGPKMSSIGRDDDSDGELIVEEMEIPHSKSRKGSHEYTQLKKKSFDGGNDTGSGSIHGLRFEVEELDLSDHSKSKNPGKAQPTMEKKSFDVSDGEMYDFQEETHEIRHSRRSFEMPRPPIILNSIVNASSKSRSSSTNRRGIIADDSLADELGLLNSEKKDKKEKKDKRRSFLGF